ncbi:ferric reductase-like transmembrane domain-containing protein [Paenibacillus thalictri]|uniref:Ferric reductase n=1 Tax=Paenibacillus thalictri TaxID=2527873 RepID=A0A4Q9DL42_9BACL|nr:ferric reductase-like transmembrane domain-containing protein [Paenibacillus thalictri]TBL73977.1 ferric reductase [Paenibacillus thalictri]
MIQFILQLPLWQIIRSFGIVSFILLTAGVCLGILYSFPFWKGITKANMYKLHMYATIAGTGIGFVHGIITVIDPYMPFAWSEVFIPFTAANNPILNGLGTLALFGMLIVILTTDLRNKLKKTLWHAIHMLSYPIFALAWVHGYFLGTDTTSASVRWMYLLCAAAVLLLTAYRLMQGQMNSGRAAGAAEG